MYTHISTWVYHSMHGCMWRSGLIANNFCLLSHPTYPLTYFFESGSFIEPGAQMQLVCLASEPQVPSSLHHLVLSLQACTPAPRSLWGFLHSELGFSCKHFSHQAISPASKEKIVSLPLGVEKTTLQVTAFNFQFSYKGNWGQTKLEEFALRTWVIFWGTGTLIQPPGSMLPALFYEPWCLTTIS